MTTDLVIQRIIEHRATFETRNKRKEKKEVAAWKALKNANDTTQVVMI